MIIVLAPAVTPADTEHTFASVEESDRQVHLPVGVERTLVGVIGADDPELNGAFESLPGVESVHCLTKPYKLVHNDPEHAMSDGAQSLTFKNFTSMMRSVSVVASAVGRSLPGVLAHAS